MATKTSPTLAFAQLRQQIRSGHTSPVYLLHGSEGYFTDELVKTFEELVPEEERDFNLYIMYGHEASPEAVVEVCRRFPMMADRIVVILKEAQNMRADQLKKFRKYISDPNPTTVLVIASRGEAVKSKEVLSAIKDMGVVFESAKLSDRDILPAISALVKEKQLTIDAKALSMLRDHIGSDMSRLYNEIDKLALILGPGSMITPEAVERNIGISKDYNNYELLDAINTRNAAKVFAIVDYFASNPRSNPSAVTATVLFNQFSNLLIYHYTRDKSPSGYMDALGLKSPWALKHYELAARNYNVRQTIEIISAIREFDARSKGIGSRQGEYALLRDLAFRILTSSGIIRMD